MANMSVMATPLPTHRISLDGRTLDVTEAELTARLGPDADPFLVLRLGETLRGVTRIACEVASFSNPSIKYRLTFEPADQALGCTCPAFEFGRGRWCKHVRHAVTEELRATEPRREDMPRSQVIARRQRMESVAYDGAEDTRRWAGAR